MTTMIINKPDRLIVTNWPEDEIAIWAIQAYSFLLPYNIPFDAATLARLIPEHYDENEPHTAAAIKALQEL